MRNPTRSHAAGRKVLFIVLSCGAALFALCKKAGTPPSPPDIVAGPQNCRVNVVYTYTAVAFCPDNGNVSVRFDWGDTITSEWSAFVASGDSVTMSHAWTSQDTYRIKAQAKAVQGATSDWSGPHLVIVVPDGTLKWRCRTGDYGWSSPAVSTDGTVYVGQGDGYLYAIWGDSPLANTPWPKFRHDNKNTGRVGGPKK